jgi:hypothetical protein
MDFDKRRPAKREIENLDSCYLNFEPEEPKEFGAGTKEHPVEQSPQSEAMRMRSIDLIDWTSAINQLSVDHAKPHL